MKKRKSASRAARPRVALSRFNPCLFVKHGNSQDIEVSLNSCDNVGQLKEVIKDRLQLPDPIQDITLHVASNLEPLDPPLSISDMLVEKIEYDDGPLIVRSAGSHVDVSLRLDARFRDEYKRYKEIALQLHNDKDFKWIVVQLETMLIDHQEFAYISGSSGKPCSLPRHLPALRIILLVAHKLPRISPFMDTLILYQSP